MNDHPALTLVRMPSVADLNLPASPRADPLSYPGVTLAGSYLLLDNWVYWVTPPPGVATVRSGVGTVRSGVGTGLRGVATVRSGVGTVRSGVGTGLRGVGTVRSGVGTGLRGFGPGQWEVVVDGGPLADLGARRVEPLDAALSLAEAPLLGMRRPVVAFASNSAPAQLIDKFASLPARHRVIPVLNGSAAGLGLSHSPHVSPAGYVPYVLVDTGGDNELPVSLLWLDTGQLRAMNRTEPNYRLVVIDEYPVTLPTGDHVVTYLAYQGKWGALRAETGILPTVARSQRDVFARLTGAPWFTALVGTGEARSLMLQLSADHALREAVRLEMARQGLAINDGLRTGRYSGPPAERTGLDYGL